MKLKDILKSKDDRDVNMKFKFQLLNQEEREALYREPHTMKDADLDWYASFGTIQHPDLWGNPFDEEEKVNEKTKAQQWWDNSKKLEEKPNKIAKILELYERDGIKGVINYAHAFGGIVMDATKMEKLIKRAIKDMSTAEKAMKPEFKKPDMALQYHAYVGKDKKGKFLKGGFGMRELDMEFSGRKFWRGSDTSEIDLQHMDGEFGPNYMLVDDDGNEEFCLDADGQQTDTPHYFMQAEEGFVCTKCGKYVASQVQGFTLFEADDVEPIELDYDEVLKPSYIEGLNGTLKDAYINDIAHNPLLEYAGFKAPSNTLPIPKTINWEAGLPERFTFQHVLENLLKHTKQASYKEWDDYKGLLSEVDEEYTTYEKVSYVEDVNDDALDFDGDDIQVTEVKDPKALFSKKLTEMPFELLGLWGYPGENKKGHGPANLRQGMMYPAGQSCIWSGIRYSRDRGIEKVVKCAHLLSKKEKSYLRHMFQDKNMELPWYVRNLLPSYKSTEEWRERARVKIDRDYRKPEVKETKTLDYVNNVIRHTYIGDYMRNGKLVKGHYRPITKRCMIANMSNLQKAKEIMNKKTLFVNLYPPTYICPQGYAVAYQDKGGKIIAAKTYHYLENQNIEAAIGNLKNAARAKGYDIIETDMNKACRAEAGNWADYRKVKTLIVDPQNYIKTIRTSGFDNIVLK